MVILRKEQTSIPTIKGIEVGCRRHFTKSEWEAVRKSGYKRVKGIAESIPFEKLENKFFFNECSTEWRSYIYTMAYWQRIRLPLDIIITAKIITKNYPLSETENFIYLKELFETNYEDLCIFSGNKLNANSTTLKKNLEDRLMHMAMELWLSGYAILPEFGSDVINDYVLELVWTLAKSNNTKRHTIRLFSELLRLSSDSPVESVPSGRPTAHSFVEREKAIWERQFLATDNNKIINSLHDFAFGPLLSRVNNATIEDVYDKDSKLLLSRIGKKPISYKTWQSGAHALRKFAILCMQMNRKTIFEALNVDDNGPVTVFLSKGKTSGKNFLQEWAKWYSAKENIALNLKNIFPRIFSRNDIYHGRVWNVGMVHTFIQTLLDPHNPLINENDIMDFRCRRAALICLELASRPHEVLLLTHDCIKMDHFGLKYVVFQKTKTKRPNPHTDKLEFVHQRPIKGDVEKWIYELQNVAPKEKIYMPSDRGMGDDLNEYRLFASRYDRGPITVNKFGHWLTKLQMKIWPDRKTDYFTPSSFRSLSLTYEALMNQSEQVIENKAGHSNPESKIPYIMTLPANEVQKFGEILEEGVWHFDPPETEYLDNLDDDLTDSNPSDIEKVINVTKDIHEGSIPLSHLLNVSNALRLSASKKENAKLLFEKAIQEVSALDITNKINHDLELPMIGGYTHNCTAHALLNCGHTEDHCRACLHYRPDEGTEAQHKVAVFTSMVHYFRCLVAEKEYKTTGLREMIFQKTSELKLRLEKTVEATWIHGFGMKKTEAIRLHKWLWERAKFYFKNYAMDKPMPTPKEALYFLEKGEFISNVQD